MTPDIIFVRDMLTDINIGVYDHEKGRAQKVRINVAAEPEIWPDATCDDIEGAVSYDIIIDHIFRLTKDRHIHLVETLAENIAAACLAERIRKTTVRIEKMDAHPFAIVGVEITRTKG